MLKSCERWTRTLGFITKKAMIEIMLDFNKDWLRKISFIYSFISERLENAKNVIKKEML